jgi:hypothetical protein
MQIDIARNFGLLVTLAATATLGVMTWLCAPLLTGSRTGRMFGLGTLFAVVPVCATFPADRLLFFVGLGGMAIVAMLVTTQVAWFRRPFIWGLVLIHVVLAPPLLFIRSETMGNVKKPLVRAAATLPRGKEVADKTVILVNAPSDPFGAYMLPELAADGVQGLPRLRWLSAGTTPVQITRENPRTLLVSSEAGFMEHTSEQMMRSLEWPLPPGATIELTGMTIEIVRSTPDGRPALVRVRFEKPLEDPSLIWMQWGSTGYVPFTLPPIGGVANLPRIDFLKVALQP